MNLNLGLGGFDAKKRYEKTTEVADYVSIMRLLYNVLIAMKLIVSFRARERGKGHNV